MTDAWADFSLLAGGPLQRLRRAIGVPDTPFGAICLGVSLALLAWVPLLVLNALADTLTGGVTMPFARNVATHVRLLVAIPLLVLTEAIFDQRVRQVIRTLAVSELVPRRQHGRLENVLRQATRWRESWIAEAVLIVITILLIRDAVRTDLSAGVATWRTASGEGLTAAGWWYVVASLPVFQYLTLRWVMRLLIWCVLLWRIARLDLQLVPTHPDHSAGLGGFGVAHVALAPLNMALTGVIAANIAERMSYGDIDVPRIASLLVVAIIGGTLIFLAPLLFFTPRLIVTKQEGLIEYGDLAFTYTRAFDMKWLRGGASSTDVLLGSSDVQSLADLANSFEVIRRMRFVPIERQQLLFLVAAAALPAAPLVLFFVPLDELIVRIVKTLVRA